MITAEDSFPSKSEAYLYAESAFFQQFNEVDIYVEDEGMENFYLAILKSRLNGWKIGRVFSLRGKDNVKRHCLDNTSNRTAVYIVDKDLDDILSKILVRENLFYLNEYCIENALLEPQAVLRFVLSELPKMEAKQINAKVNFEEFIRDSFHSLGKLFNLFCVAHQHLLNEIRTTGGSPHVYCKKEAPFEIDQSKVDALWGDVGRALKKRNGQVSLPGEFARFKVFFEGPEQRRNISGEYVLRLLIRKLQSTFWPARELSFDSVAFRLAEYCIFESLRPLVGRIEGYLNQCPGRSK